MNRKKPIKKNYFAFLTQLPNVWVQRTIVGIIVFAVILFGFNEFAYDDTVGAEIFGLLVLIGLGLSFLLILFFVVEKIIGISCLRGVEWVGRVTLDLIDWIIIKFQQWRGVDIRKNTPLTPQSTDNASSKKPYQYKEPQINISSIESKMVSAVKAPYLGHHFSAHADDDVHSGISSVSDDTIQEVLASHSTVSLDDENPESTSCEQPIKENEDIRHLSSHSEVNTSEAMNNSELKPSDDVSLGSDLLTEVSPELSTDHKIDALEGIDKSELNLSVDIPSNSELIVDPLDEELKRLFAEQQKESTDEEMFSEDERDSALSRTNSIEAQDESDVQPHFNVQNLFSNHPSNDIKSFAVTDEGHRGNALSDLSGKNLYSNTLLEQAEKTTATIISSLFTDKTPPKSIEQAYSLPTLDLLQEHQTEVQAYSAEDLAEMSRSVERVLNDYKVSVEVMGAYPGPIITCFELALAPGIKVSRISGLAKDLARALLVTSVRVVEIIEGTPYVGLEIPNKERELVSFREILSSEQFQMEKSPLTLALGKDVSGKTVVSDLGKMPHLLVAGTTGSGKSVAINTMILSLLYKATSEQVRLIMIDPKMLELSVYEGIPHLLTPVVTDMKEAHNALRWAVAEMERRYKLMSKVGVRNLAGFNQKINEAAELGETIRDPLFQLTAPLAEGESFPVLSTLPHIVIVIDELADMMMIVGKKVEELIARLAQKARAAGIHLILATQRPSVDVLTGLIKANVPTRMSFQVSSKIDSRTILDQGGAEALLGNGDMLFLPSGTSIPIRAHGAFVDDAEVHAVVDYLKAQGVANYLPEILQEEPVENVANSEVQTDETDVLYGEAVDFVLETGKASISSVQRRFKVGYNRAARMVDQMEEEGIVSEPEGNGSRRVLNRE